MKKPTIDHYAAIQKLAQEYGIVQNNIKIFNTQSDKGDYAFLITLQEGTSGYQQLGFQAALSKLLGDEDEEIDVVTQGGLEKRVQQYKITKEEKEKYLSEAKPLKDFLESAQDKTINNNDMKQEQKPSNFFSNIPAQSLTVEAKNTMATDREYAIVTQLAELINATLLLEPQNLDAEKFIALLSQLPLNKTKAMADAMKILSTAFDQYTQQTAPGFNLATKK